jgi:hypothetical protein
MLVQEQGSTELDVSGPILNSFFQPNSNGLELNNNGITPATNEAKELPCPASVKMGCILAFELNVICNGLVPFDGNNVVAAVLYVDGSISNIFPANPVGVTPSCGGGGSDAHSIFWTTTVSAGRTHTAQSYLYVSTAGGYATSAARTLKIEIHKLTLVD